MPRRFSEAQWLTRSPVPRRLTPSVRHVRLQQQRLSRVWRGAIHQTGGCSSVTALLTEALGEHPVYPLDRAPSGRRGSFSSLGSRRPLIFHPDAQRARRHGIGSTAEHASIDRRSAEVRRSRCAVSAVRGGQRMSGRTGPRRRVLGPRRRETRCGTEARSASRGTGLGTADRASAARLRASSSIGVRIASRSVREPARAQQQTASAFTNSHATRTSTSSGISSPLS